MIRFGPGGIPLSCKGRTLRDGLEDVHTLGLTAIEVQLVRVNLVERYVTEEEVGLTPRDIEGELVVKVIRKQPGKKQPEKLINPDIKFKPGDIRCSLASGIVRDYKELAELSEISRELDIFFSIHTPYYMDLISGGEMTEKSKESIEWCGILANEIGAKAVITHVGLYGRYNSKKATERLVANVREIRDWYKKRNITANLGLETSGKQEVFGDLDEILAVCKRVSGVIPVLNFAHIHARGNGSLKKKEDFQEIFDKTLKITKNNLYAHFSGVEYEEGNENRYTPIKKGDLKFEPLAECILDNNIDITIISGSPLLEHDAMYMKVILERVLTRREAKAMRAAAKKVTKVSKVKKAVKEEKVSKEKKALKKFKAVKKGKVTKAKKAVKGAKAAKKGKEVKKKKKPKVGKVGKGVKGGKKGKVSKAGKGAKVRKVGKGAKGGKKGKAAKPGKGGKGAKKGKKTKGGKKAKTGKPGKGAKKAKKTKGKKGSKAVKRGKGGGKK
ncbi:MAG: TIM barrel protein [Thermoplasmata archaeon]|nr:MAG: TIM barrel protein [Thermoplasmata archaeon]